MRDFTLTVNITTKSSIFPAVPAVKYVNPLLDQALTDTLSLCFVVWFRQGMSTSPPHPKKMLDVPRFCEWFCWFKWLAKKFTTGPHVGNYPSPRTEEDAETARIVGGLQWCFEICRDFRCRGRELLYCLNLSCTSKWTEAAVISTELFGDFRNPEKTLVIWWFGMPNPSQTMPNAQQDDRVWGFVDPR